MDGERDERILVNQKPDKTPMTLDKVAVAVVVGMFAYTLFYRLRTVGIMGWNLRSSHPVVHGIVKRKRSFIVWLNRKAIGTSFIDPNEGRVVRPRLLERFFGVR